MRSKEITITQHIIYHRYKWKIKRHEKDELCSSTAYEAASKYNICYTLSQTSNIILITIIVNVRLLIINIWLRPVLFFLAQKECVNMRTC